MYIAKLLAFAIIFTRVSVADTPPAEWETALSDPVETGKNHRFLSSSQRCSQAGRNDAKCWEIGGCVFRIAQKDCVPCSHMPQNQCESGMDTCVWKNNACVPKTFRISARELSQFERLKRQRQRGYHCHGKYYPPNSNTFLLDCNLSRLGKAHLRDMNVRHYSPTHYTKEGNFVDGNIAWGRGTPISIWNGSPPHCYAMMNADLKVAGMAMVGDRSTLIFSSALKQAWVPVSELDTSCYEQQSTPTSGGTISIPTAKPTHAIIGTPPSMRTPGTLLRPNTNCSKQKMRSRTFQKSFGC
jgi:hypothetical protein